MTFAIAGCSSGVPAGKDASPASVASLKDSVPLTELPGEAIRSEPPMRLAACSPSIFKVTPPGPAVPSMLAVLKGNELEFQKRSWLANAALKLRESSPSSAPPLGNLTAKLPVAAPIIWARG